MGQQTNSAYRTTLMVAAIASLVAFFLPVIDLMIFSLSGFDIVRAAFSGGGEMASNFMQGFSQGMGSSGPASTSPSSPGIAMYVPLLMPISAAAKFATWAAKSRYSHIGTAILAFVVVTYYGITMSFSLFGIGTWVWLAASIACPVVAYGTDPANQVDWEAEAADANCSNCGAPLPSTSGFCDKCGAMVE